MTNGTTMFAAPGDPSRQAILDQLADAFAARSTVSA
jgi:hypothetical protein